MRRCSLAVILISAALVGCGSKSSPVEAKSDSPAESSRTPTLTTVRALTRSVAAAVQATGSFVAKESSDVAPQAAGRVIETPVDVGDFVKKGQLIARLDDRDPRLRLEQAEASEQQAQAAVRQAQSRIGLGAGQPFDANAVPEVLSAKAASESAAAQAKQAEADAKRYENLVMTGDVSRSAYEKARTSADTALAQANSARQQYEATLNAARQNFQGVTGAQASLESMHAQTELARKALEDTLIRAPFAGYVSARPIANGQYVALTARIATVLLITPIKLELQVPELNAPQMKLNANVEASVPGYPERIFNGKVTGINPAIDPNSRTFTVIAEFANADLALKPGMFATARILLPGSSLGIFVPRTSINTDPTTSSSQLFFIRDGKARVAVVQLGMIEGDQVQILSGLAADAIVATDHLQDLYDGQSVQAVMKSSEPAGKGQ